MATVAIRRRTDSRAAAPPRKHPKAYIQDESGRRFIFPFAPRILDAGGDAPEFTLVKRPGRRPLRRRVGGHSRTLRFSAIIGETDAQEPIEAEINQLRQIARHGERVLLYRLGQISGDWWKIDDLTITTEAMQAGTNRITRATANVSLGEDYSVRPKIARTAPKPPPPKPPRPATRTYVVKKGDTLWEISRKFLGDPYRWKEIAKLNGVKDPRKLQIGHKLTIPPR
ncbi:LysM peptidoglycan-binding domain-containing protein [Jiangella muralis]|uniref:LysM peptidoglycan-binding domain-containing protein n=1 Tax=Jiangella muralis TaxID=702383 RepID=UPI00069D503E|nr:LysM domain-containing protein [Jiangella muralis]